MKKDQKLLGLKKHQQAPLVLLGAARITAGKTPKTMARTTSSARSGDYGGND